MRTNLEIQKALTLLGFYTGKLDGDFGPISKAALRAFQKAQGLVPDGVFGPLTEKRLFPTDEPVDPVSALETGPYTREQVLKVAPTARSDIIEVLVSNADVFRRYGVTTKLQLAHFLAQICVETGGLKSLSENMNYSAKRITQVWPSRFRTLASALPYANNPQKLANKVYGTRLGNRGGDDGWRYRGGGMLQTTGRSNYAKIGYENDPEELRKPFPALTSALNYWKDRDINFVADRDDVSAVRRRINGGTIGLEEARRYLKRAKDALGV